MEKTTVSAKLIGIILAGVTVIAVAAVALVFFVNKKEDTYRSIQIYELEGVATIEREGIGSMDAVENLYLESGDRICVADDSYMRLRLDDDKYVCVEENSILTIVAEGTKDASKTSIHLEQGAVTNELRDKLNDNSSYDVTTPNSVMAVRGTIFRVEIVIDENGEIYTRLSTFEGKVESRLISPDGVIQAEVVLVEEGKEVIIHMDQSVTEYLSEPKDIDYEELPLQALEFLLEIVENGTRFSGISMEQLEELIEKKVAELGQDLEQEKRQDTEPPKEQNAEQSKDQGTQQTVNQENQTGEQPANQTATGQSQTTQQTQASKEAQKQAVTGEQTESTEESEESTEGTEDSKEQTESTEESEESTEGTEDSEESTESTEESQPTEKAAYTVTFTYNGVVFGTQTVEEGQAAVCPKLAPAASGAWDFDFTQAITADTTIEWK